MTSEIKVDTISEQTSANGVTIDGLTIKDGNIIGDVALAGTTPTFTIGDAGAEDAALIFDGNAQDFYVALDDSADDLVIGLGNTIGTTPIMSFDENKDVVIHDGGLTITTADNTDTLTLKSTDADAAVGPVLTLHRESSSPADDDIIGRINFIGEDSGGTDTTYGRIETLIMQESNGSEDATMEFRIMKGGTERNILELDRSEVCINEDSQDIDFRVESNGNTHMLFVDGGNDHVNIGTATDLGSTLNVAGTVHIETSGNETTLHLKSTDADASAGPRISMNRDSSSPADGDDLGKIFFFGKNDADEDQGYAEIMAEISDASDGTEDGRLVFNMRQAGATVEAIRFEGSNGVVVNEGSADVDFRVESNANPYQLYVDGGVPFVGISSINSAVSQSVNGGDIPALQIKGTTSGTSSTLLSRHANDGNGPILFMYKSRNGTPGSSTIVADDDQCGNITFMADDGTDGNSQVARIHAAIDGTPGANDTPGRMVFMTTPDGSQAASERMRILANGNICIGQSDAQGDTQLLVAYSVSDKSVIHARATHGTYTDQIAKFSSNRSDTTGFDFLVCGSNNEADNEFVLRGDGNAFCDGSFSGGGADYAEYFEWKDGNSSDEDRRGYSVVLDDNKIVKATDSDDVSKIIGVISATPAVIGDADIRNWKSKYLKDDFGTYVWEDFTVTEWIEAVEDSDDIEHSYPTDEIPDGVTAPSDATVITTEKDRYDNTINLKRRKLNPDWNKDTTYISREDRKEWDTVGLMGKLRLKKGQPTGTNWIKMRDISDTVEEWLVR